MTQDKIYTRFYTADDGKTFVRVSDGFIMGKNISLSPTDDISNYDEIEDPTPKKAAKSIRELMGIAEPAAEPANDNAEPANDNAEIEEINNDIIVDDGE